jgi:transposase
MQGQSLRQIANGAGIGLNSIHNSVKSYRKILKDELSEDLMDYFNGDYDKI